MTSPGHICNLFILATLLSFEARTGGTQSGTSNTNNRSQNGIPTPTRMHSVNFKYAGQSLVIGGEEEQYVDEYHEWVIVGEYCEQNAAAVDSRIEKYLGESQAVIEKTESSEGMRYVISSEKLFQGKIAMLRTNKTRCYNAIFAPSVDLLEDFENSRK